MCFPFFLVMRELEGSARPSSRDQETCGGGYPVTEQSSSTSSPMAAEVDFFDNVTPGPAVENRKKVKTAVLQNWYAMAHKYGQDRPAQHSVNTIHVHSLNLC